METKIEETNERESSGRKRRKVTTEDKEDVEENKPKPDNPADSDRSTKSESLISKAKESEMAEDEQLEDFEVGASEHVTKQDAMKLYCLPSGTLAVCTCIEKPNPRNTSWKPMKLYLRSEIRKRARERFGGLKGLIEERKSREVKRLEKDMSKAKDFFR